MHARYSPAMALSVAAAAAASIRWCHQLDAVHNLRPWPLLTVVLLPPLPPPPAAAAAERRRR